MKIAYVVPSLAAKGPVIVVKELVTQMVKNGHECVILYFDDKIPLDFPCHTLCVSQKYAVDFTQYDIVHSHGLRPDLFVYRFREYSGRVHYISTIHSYVLQDFSHQYNWFVSQIFGRLWMKFLKRHDKIVALSMDAMNYYERWFAKEKLVYVYNTRNLDMAKKLSEDELKELLVFKENCKLIGINALLSPVKGVDIIIKELSSLPNYKLFVVGDGKSRKKLEILAHDMGVKDRCHFAGIKPNAYRYLPYYDIFAMPSRSEGFPLALLEAAIYSKPSVVSDIPVVKEAFNECEVAMFQLNDPKSIIAAILEATGNNEMGKKMYLKYIKSYSPENLYRSYISVYEELSK